MSANSRNSLNMNNNLTISSVFDSPCSSVSSSVSEKQDTIIVLDDENDIDAMNNNEKISKLIDKLDINAQLIIIKPNLPIRTCTTAVDYPNLSNIHIVMINSSRVSTSEHVTKRQLYMSEPCSVLNIPIRTRIYDPTTSLLGFVFEIPCPDRNNNRYLVLYDDFTASYRSSSQIHLCLCQDFRRHLSNIEYKDLKLYYEQIFDGSIVSSKSNYNFGDIIRVKRFGQQYHNVRIIDIDCSIIEISFFERKTQKKMWIHSKAPIIEQTMQNSPLSPSTSTDLSRLRKRKHSDSQTRKVNKNQSINLEKKKSFDLINESMSTTSRNNILTTYYINILLPKFRVLNALPTITHKCSQHCVLSAEEFFLSKRIETNPYLLPFECNWSIVDSKPRGYRTPCGRLFYSLDDIEQYLYRTQSKLSIKYFVDGVLNRFKPLLDDHDMNYIVMNDLSQNQEDVRIAVYNDVDNDKPDNFTYIRHIRPIDNRIAIALNDTTTTSCCDCTDNCSDRMKCACFRKTLTQAQLNRDAVVIEKEKHRSTLSYMLQTTGYQHKHLLNPISSGIYECNSKCSCHRDHCSNRLVQQGLFVHLQLFKDRIKGWGLRALHDIPRGTFISQYIGELLTSDQGHERAQIMDDKYQTSLDLIKQICHADGLNIDNDDEPYVLDGSLYSNLGKYFNHSCEPNMFIQNVFIETHNLHFPNLALFTQTHVKAGEELTWHYNCELLPDREIKCFCGANNCRGRLL